MPGIITHNKVLKESIKFLSKKAKKNYLLKSLDALFKTPLHRTAALFGSLGPNLFDYVPFRGKKFYGSEISFFFHDGNLGPLLSNMISRINSYEDKNNEWAAIQRAYLYGLISHLVADSIFHPFMFYFSGFPDSYDKASIKHFREQNLLYQYHIDYYFLLFDENRADFSFSMKEMLPVKKKYRLQLLEPAIKSFLLESINSTFPDIYRKIIKYEPKNPDKRFINSFGYLDLVLYFIHFVYWVKFNKNARLSALITEMKRKKLLFSDFLVIYPPNQRIHRDITNLHRDKWQFPDGRAGFHYESVDNLLLQAKERTVEIWERLESSLYAKPDSKIISELEINLYTGSGKKYTEMKAKNPLKL